MITGIKVTSTVSWGQFIPWPKSQKTDPVQILNQVTPEGVRRSGKPKKVYVARRNGALWAKNHIDQNQQNSTLIVTVFNALDCFKWVNLPSNIP